MKPSITVIIPSCNRADFLKKAVESVFAQTFSCDEIIVVDDGSTDRTGQVVEALASVGKTKVRYVRQENRGAAAARNRGIKEASGSLLCFLDSDDAFVPEKLEVQWHEMQKEPDYQISHTREIWYRRGVLLNQKKKHQPPHGESFRRCLEMCVVGMSTVMIRRELFDRHGLFDENLVCCEDYDFWLRVSVSEPFLLVDHPLTVKDGGREDQLSVIHRVGMDRYRIRSIVNLLEQAKLTDEQFRWALDELRKKSEIYGQGCLKHGREEEARLYLDLPARFR